MADKITRRHLARLSGAVAAGLAASGQAAAQEAPPAPPSPEQLLEQRKAARVRAGEELGAFELGYADEPLFRLVVR